MNEPQEPQGGRVYRPRNQFPWEEGDRGQRGPAANSYDDDDSLDVDGNTPGLFGEDGDEHGADPNQGAEGYGSPGSYGGAPSQAAADAQAAAEPVAQPDFDAATRDDIRIGLWGSPQSGKTTFLAALRHATNSATCGTWNVMPLTQQSSNLMYDLSQKLNKGSFPEATQPGAPSARLRWLFQGNLAGTDFARRRLGRRSETKSRFVLSLVDVSGLAFGYKPLELGVTRVVAEQALNDLSEASGLIYLFDPVGERDNRDSVDYVNRTITEMKRRYAEAGGREQHLPQHVSICITKFDHPQVFQEARDKGLVESGPDGLPRVPDRNAKEFFTMLCKGKFWSKHYEQGERSAQFIMNELQATFGEHKIEYFVTSSIGFWKPMGWSGELSDFNPDDFANYLPGDAATHTPPSIRGAISPINVLEPLVKLHQRVARHPVVRRGK